MLSLEVHPDLVFVQISHFPVWITLEDKTIDNNIEIPVDGVVFSRLYVPSLSPLTPKLTMLKL